MTEITDAPLSAGRGRNEWTVLYHTILIGVSSLIPFPFIDDVIAGYFRRRLIWRLAKKSGRQLSSQQVRQLGQEQGFGCVSGCLMVVGYLLEETIQTFLPWLKWQKGIDRATDAYYSGYLWDVMFSSASFDANQAGAYGRAVERAKKGTNPALVKNLIRGTFTSSKGLLRDVARGLVRFWGYYLRLPFRLFRRRGRRGSNPLDESVEEEQPRIFALAGEITGNLRDRLGAVPQEHYDRLRARLGEELRVEGLTLE
jgi:hypothetical protein